MLKIHFLKTRNCINDIEIVIVKKKKNKNFFIINNFIYKNNTN